MSLLQKRAASRRVLMLGHPNAGKSSLFNQLTGLNSHTANYPGTTVDLRSGHLTDVELIDAPGVYSLKGELPEQEVVSTVLEKEHFDLAVVVIDGSSLQHQLPFVVEVAQLQKLPVVVAVNMIDVVGDSIDLVLLEQELGVPVMAVSARSGQGVNELRQVIESGNLQVNENSCAGCCGCAAVNRCQFADNVYERVLNSAISRQRTEKIDNLITHPLLGIPVFLSVMFGLFFSVFFLAAYPMDLIDQAFGFLTEAVAGDTLFQSFLADGLIAGFGGVIIFVPQICLLFLCLSLLEDSGYLARAVVLVDRMMRRFGLPGQAFVPMLSAHACAIPAILSTRLIKSKADRLRTIMILPLLTCSARLPVYAMVAALLFADNALYGTYLFVGGYALGITAAVLASLVFKSTIVPGEAQRLLIELPQYRMPSFRVATKTMLLKSWSFLKGAGPIILMVSVFLWIGTTFPEQGEGSYMASVGKFIQPVFEPLGFDWQITLSVLASFAAREVVVSSLSVLAGVSNEDGIFEALSSLARADGSPLFDLPTSISFFVFFVLAMQCLPTNVVTYKETGSLKWPILQFTYMTILAYSAAFIAYNVVQLF